MLIPVIPAGSGKTEEIYPAMLNNPTGQIETTIRWNIMPDIMVSEDIEERHIIVKPQGTQILGRQITTAKNQINLVNRCRSAVINQFGRDAI